MYDSFVTINLLTMQLNILILDYLATNYLSIRMRW